MTARHPRPCRRCWRFWRERAAELFAAAVDHLTRRDGDLETFAKQLSDQAHRATPRCQAPDPDSLPRGGA